MDALAIAPDKNMLVSVEHIKVIRQHSYVCLILELVLYLNNSRVFVVTPEIMCIFCNKIKDRQADIDAVKQSCDTNDVRKSVNGHLFRGKQELVGHETAMFLL